MLTCRFAAAFPLKNQPKPSIMRDRLFQGTGEGMFRKGSFSKDETDIDDGVLMADDDFAKVENDGEEEQDD